MTKLIVHVGTDTFFDIEDDIVILDTDYIPSEDVGQAFESFDNGSAAEWAAKYGKPILNYIDIDLF